MHFPRKMLVFVNTKIFKLCSTSSIIVSSILRGLVTSNYFRLVLNITIFVFFTLMNNLLDFSQCAT